MGLPKDSPFYPVPADRVILERPNCLAFLDGYPVSKGHTLVIPFQPVISIFELDEHMQSELWDAVRRVRDILEERYSPDGFNIGVNDRRAAGQTVPHAHIHVIPRYEGDVADPRGGVRWVIPDKARYWKEGGDGPAVEVVGIDVGVAKGLHVVGLRLIGTGTEGDFSVLGNGVSVEDAAQICMERRPACVAIDSPPGWAAAGHGRHGERELQALGIQLFSTPSDPKKQRSAFYGWMKVGSEIFARLRPEYPLYRRGEVRRHALEVFPHASAVALAGRHRPNSVQKTAWRTNVLADCGHDVSALRNADCVDAALAAVTAGYALRGRSSAFGDPAEGVIVTPFKDSRGRFQKAQGSGGIRR